MVKRQDGKEAILWKKRGMRRRRRDERVCGARFAVSSPGPLEEHLFLTALSSFLTKGALACSLSFPCPSPRPALCRPTTSSTRPAHNPLRLRLPVVFLCFSYKYDVRVVFVGFPASLLPSNYCPTHKQNPRATHHRCAWGSPECCIARAGTDPSPARRRPSQKEVILSLLFYFIFIMRPTFLICVRPRRTKHGVLRVRRASFVSSWVAVDCRGSLVDRHAGVR